MQNAVLGRVKNGTDDFILNPQLSFKGSYLVRKLELLGADKKEDRKNIYTQKLIIMDLARIKRIQQLCADLSIPRLIALGAVLRNSDSGMADCLIPDLENVPKELKEYVREQ